MANLKVYKKGNYIIVEDSFNKYWEEIALNVKISKLKTDSTEYTISFKEINEKWENVPFANIKDQNGNAYASQAAFETWYTSNTGFNAATTESVAALTVSLSEKQDLLVSGDNIKTINGATLLGSGNIVISGGSGGGSGDMTMAVYDTDGDNIVDKAETIPITVRNQEINILTKGTIVYLSGSTGNRPNAYRAQANAESTSSGTFGVVMSDIGVNADGLVAAIGTLHDLDTRTSAGGATHPFTNVTLVAGDNLWLDPNNAGYVTNVKPQAPNHVVFIGVVARISPTIGRIVYKIANGVELNEIHDVLISGPADNDFLYYDNATSLWKHKQLTKALVGLSNVDNTSDADKPVSIAQSTALGLKENSITAGTTGQYWRGDKSWQTLDKTAVGLNNVPNTDATNPANITQTSSYRFVTDAEKATWNSASSSFIPKLTGHETFRGVNYTNNSTSETTSGGVTMSTSASTAARSVATTNYATRNIRKGFTASIVSTGRYTGTRGSGLLWYLSGGFKYVCDVYISDTAYGSGCRQFYGVQGSTADLTYNDVTLVTSLINCIGVGSDSADTNLQIFHNDASGTATKIDLGASFPANRSAGAALTTIYSIVIYNAPNSSSVLVEVTNKETGAVAQNTISTDLPATTQGLNFFASRCMGGGGGTTNTGQFDLSILGVYSI